MANASIGFRPAGGGKWREIESDYPWNRIETLKCDQCPFTVEMQKMPRFNRNSALPRFSMARGLMRRHIKLNHP